jgi:hypothetical protein
MRVRDKQMYFMREFLHHTQPNLTQPRARVENNPVFAMSEF